MGSSTLPKTQYAVQLVGPGQLTLNKSKPVAAPVGHQILARVECVSLCFSDLKLLKQFSAHSRKGEIISGLSGDILAAIPSYVPGTRPTVPGHEVTCRIVAVGDKVRHHATGERCLVQTDYRDLPTASSNAAFGYNFEGGLQEYVLMDERVVIDPHAGERFLIPVAEDLGASAVALVEPWACVEDSYVNPERQTVREGGRALVVYDSDANIASAEALLAGRAANISTIKLGGPQCVASIADNAFDDIIYFGASKAIIEILNDKLGQRGMMNIVLGGRRIGQPVSIGVGRVHYGMTRWIGTTGSNAADSYKTIPACGEVRPNDRMLVIGAGGPMGQMHVIRTLCANTAGVSVVGTDMDDSRIESLRAKTQPLTKSGRVALRLVNTHKSPVTEKFTYFALMAPVASLVAQAVRDSMPGCLINIFAGIPAPTRQDVDMDTYISNRCYMFGTSGSVIRDMKIVLDKIERGTLDTNCSVDAVCGMAGAVDGIAAVDNRLLAGKIVVYPALHDVGLIPLTELGKIFPKTAAKLKHGQWCREAEEELLREHG